MNIFFLDKDPVKAAQYQCDKHVVKMILESAQLLCSAHHILGSIGERPTKFYKLTHKNHPCAIHIRKNPSNYKWMTDHANALCDEYTYRYGKVHASESLIDWCFWNYPKFDEITFGEQPQAMPEEYRDEDPVVAYRNYYSQHKMKTIDCRWTKRVKPEWAVV